MAVEAMHRDAPPFFGTLSEAPSQTLLPSQHQVRSKSSTLSFVLRQSGSAALVDLELMTLPLSSPRTVLGLQIRDTTIPG